VAVEGSRVFSARSSSGNIRAIDWMSGEELWRVQTGGMVYFSPVVADGVVHIGRGDGLVAAYDADTGRELWSYRTDDQIYSTPVVHNGRLYATSDDGSVYAIATADRAARLAMYFDEGLTNRGGLGSAPEHARIATYFEDRGYERLDVESLAAFLSERTSDRTPSVVVFAMDALPDEVVSYDGRPSLFRDYLQTGGKVVWMSNPPGLVVRDEESGRPVALDRARPAALLGVDFTELNGDRYSVTPTRSGREWGLDTWWVGEGSTLPAHVTEVLAVDEIGRATAWVQSYGGPRGTGFVMTRPGVDPDVLREIRRVAEFGLVRAAPTGG